MAIEESAGRSFSIGAVFSRAFGVMGRNPLVAFGTSFVLGALPAALFGFLLIGFNVDMRQSGAMAGTIASAFMGGLVYALLRTIVQGCMVRATVADSEGRKASLGECLTVALNRLLPLIGASLLFALAVMIGFVLLLVPGIMIAVAFAVLVPVVVEERISIGDAFRRTAALTRGARWKIFGLLIVVVVIMWLFAAAAGLLQFAITGIPSMPTVVAVSPAAYVINAVVTTITITFWSTIATGLYVELREWKDGPVGKRLNEIFE